jgi:hypothetical protein
MNVKPGPQGTPGKKKQESRVKNQDGRLSRFGWEKNQELRVRNQDGSVLD